MQHQLGATRAIEIAYVGSRGHDLISARDVNQAPASPNPFNLRPNPLFADITLIESRASSEYNALQLKFQQRAVQGLSLLAAYTFGKSTDDASGFFTSAGDPNFPQNSLDPGAEEGRSSFDIRHRLSVSFAYALPFGKGNALARGLGAAGCRDLPERPAVHGRDPAGHRQQQHRPVESRVRLQRSPKRQRRSVAQPSHRRSVVQHRRVQPAGIRIVRQRRPQHPRGPGYENINLARRHRQSRRDALERLDAGHLVDQVVRWASSGVAAAL